MIGRLIVLLVSLLLVFPAAGGLMPERTRVIYQANDRQQSLMLANTNRYPVIVQTWVDHGAGDPDTANAPFVVLPPVFRLAPGGLRSISIIYNHDALPRDRESLFWLNLYEIPPVNPKQTTDSQVVLAMNTQLKILYRPEGIMKLDDVIKRLAATLRQDKANGVIELNNPSPLSVSVTSVILNTGTHQQETQPQSDMMIGRFSRKVYRLNTQPERSNPIKVKIRYIDDTGVNQEHFIPVN